MDQQNTSSPLPEEPITSKEVTVPNAVVTNLITPEAEKKKKFPLLTVASILLLVSFFVLTIGVLVLRNRQTELVADTRSQAAEFADLISGAALSCTDIILYQNDIVVTPSTLKPGDTVTIAIVANGATQARVSINQGSYTELGSDTLNSRGEFAFSYTFPATMTDVVIRADRLVSGIWQ